MKVQQKNKPINLEDREQRIARIAAFTPTALEALTMTELRELGAFLIPNARKLKKPEFIQTLLEIAKPAKELQEINQAKYITSAVESLELYGKFDINIEFIQDTYIKGLSPEEVSEIIFEKLITGNYKDSTIAKTKMKQIRIILNALAITNEEVRKWTDKLYDLLRDQVSKYHHKTNKEYAQKVEEYGTPDTIRKIKGNKVINWCNEVIDWAYKQDSLDRKWHKVSFALALTSGRRMDEIHGDTKYEIAENQTLRATGLSKKLDENFTHESPCLIDANKWLAVLNKLPENVRNQENIRVNQTIRPAMSNSLKPIWDELGFKSYKDARDFYVSYLIARDYKKTVDGSEINFAKKLLGHEAKKQTLSYEKMVIELE